MLDNKTSYTKIVLLFFVILLAIVILFYMFDEVESLDRVISYLDENEEIINFNYDSGYYKNDINLKLSPNKKISKSSKIYYTLNGSIPTTNSIEYNKKIKFKLVDGKVSVYNISVILCYKGTCSDIITKSYVITNVDTNISLINLIAPRSEFYDDYYGLFADRNLYLKDKKYEKTANLMMFDKSNSLILNQKINLLLSGGASQVLPVKSLKLIANHKFDIGFNYNFNSNDSIISQPIEYNTLKLSSGGQDLEYINLKNTSIQRLALESNFDGYKDSERCIVFINGKYYGLMNLEQSLSNSYIRKRYFLDEKKIKKTKKGDVDFFKDIDMYDKLNDLSPEVITELESKVDIDNLLLYYAIEIIINNADWPNKNFEAWSYYGEKNDNNKYTDGRYRFLLYDLDFSYINENEDFYSMWDFDKNRLEFLLKNKESVFKKLMKNDFYKDKFITIVNNLTNNSFSEDNTSKVFYEELDKIDNEQKLFMTEEEYSGFEKKFETTLKEISNRNSQLILDLKKYLNAKNDYYITFKTDNGSLLNIENLNIYKNNEITYKYNSNCVNIKASSYPGYTFKHFVVNGEIIESNEINIFSNSVVEVISEKNDSNLIINELKSNENDYIILTNISDKTINLINYYISDKKSNLTKYNLPNKKLGPKQSIKIYTKNNLDSKIGDLIVDFNLKYNERVYVYNYQKKLIEDSIYVPKLNKKEIYFRYDNSDIFKIKLQE